MSRLSRRVQAQIVIRFAQLLLYKDEEPAITLTQAPEDGMDCWYAALEAIQAAEEFWGLWDDESAEDFWEVVYQGRNLGRVPVLQALQTRKFDVDISPAYAYQLAVDSAARSLSTAMAYELHQRTR